MVERRVVLVVGEQEHVDEVDEDTGRRVRVHRAVRHPLKDHHDDEVAKQTQHEEELWNQHQEHAARLPEVSTDANRDSYEKTRRVENEDGERKIIMKYLLIIKKHSHKVKERQTDAEGHVNDSDDH